MRKVLLATLVMAALAGCTEPERAVSVLTAQGYKNITITGYKAFACDEKDTYSTGFEATAPNGSRVAGTLCSGILKGATVRF